MGKYKKIIFAVNLIIVLLVLNWLIIQKEHTIKHGDLVLLELYPLDPRSLMQGDYMSLQYEMTRQWRLDTEVPVRGYCIVKKNNRDIGKYKRLQANIEPLATDELAIKYYKSYTSVKIGAESFLFEEGQAATYEKAKYGGLRVEPNGSAVLIGLYDESGTKILSNYDIE